MKQTLLLCLALALPECLAQPATAAPYPYKMNGDRFVEMLHRPEPYATLERDQAYYYLNGLKDGTQGRTWCDVNHLKTPDLAYDLASEISRMPQAERKRSAAVLLLDLLHRKYPCPAAGRK